MLDYLIGHADLGRPSYSTDPAPSMFSSGDGKLPAYTASGADVDVLRAVAWTVRHSAAMTSSSALLFAMVEASADPDDDPQRLQTPEGAAARRAYVAKMWRWATSPAPSDQLTMSAADYEEWIAAR